MQIALPAYSSVLAVCAHPDDESFGLGAIISTLVDAGSQVSVICFTHGEASTVNGNSRALGELRGTELTAAGQVLGVTQVDLLEYPDGALNIQPLNELRDRITAYSQKIDPAVLLVFDHGGITGHPDHQHATQAALGVAPVLALRVLAWAIPEKVAHVLNDEFSTTFVGRGETELDFAISVDRTRQLEAIRCHHSQSIDNRVLWRRLELLGGTEYLRFLI